MSDRLTLPLKVALTGPTAILAVAVNSVSLVLASSWHPGIERLRISASFSAAHTVARSAGSITCPVIVIAMLLSASCAGVGQPEPDITRLEANPLVPTAMLRGPAASAEPICCKDRLHPRSLAQCVHDPRS